MHYNFTKDLKDGHDAEQEVVKRLCGPMGFQFHGSNDDNKHDLTMSLFDGPKFTVEVKNDLRSKETGNIAIEFRSRGKFSGINTTTAKFWVYKYHDNRFRALNVEHLRKDLREGVWQTATGGDPGSNTQFFLIPVSTFETWGIRI